MDAKLASFRPPFCPWPRCHNHLHREGWDWARFGTYTRKCEPRVIPRFRCGRCGRTFSTQTFSTTYYLKRPEIQIPLFYRLLACSGYRQMAREMKVHPTSVMGQAARLGRHALLALQQRRPRSALAEPLVIDGFESFAFSQYWPLHLNLAVGARSQYCYGFTHSELRRKGRMTELQKRRRQSLEAKYGRPEPRAVENGIVELLRLAVPREQELVVRSDEHQAYPRAFARLSGLRIHHERTPSIAARTRANPLFPVNLLDHLLRHNSANHKRETIAFSKRDQSVVERAAVLVLWRNYVKPASENHDWRTPAMRLGIAATPLALEKLLERRLFRTRIGLPSPWDRYYGRDLKTRQIHNPRLHRLARAF
jgi:transposase-like protein